VSPAAHRSSHSAVIVLRDLIPPPEDEPFTDIYIVLDFMESSRALLEEPEHIQYFLYQILKGMKYIHSSNVRLKRNENKPCASPAWGSYQRQVAQHTNFVNSNSNIDHEFK
jgi:serine/threonine protein kinase